MGQQETTVLPVELDKSNFSNINNFFLVLQQLQEELVFVLMLPSMPLILKLVLLLPLLVVQKVHILILKINFVEVAQKEQKLVQIKVQLLLVMEDWKRQMIQKVAKQYVVV